jgi:hypothetical protein
LQPGPGRARPGLGSNRRLFRRGGCFRVFNFVTARCRGAACQRGASAGRHILRASVLARPAGPQAALAKMRTPRRPPARARRAASAGRRSRQGGRPAQRRRRRAGRSRAAGRRAALGGCARRAGRRLGRGGGSGGCSGSGAGDDGEQDLVAALPGRLEGVVVPAARVSRGGRLTALRRSRVTGATGERRASQVDPVECQASARAAIQIVYVAIRLMCMASTRVGAQRTGLEQRTSTAADGSRTRARQYTPVHTYWRARQCMCTGVHGSTRRAAPHTRVGEGRVRLHATMRDDAYSAGGDAGRAWPTGHVLDAIRT